MSLSVTPSPSIAIVSFVGSLGFRGFEGTCDRRRTICSAQTDHAPNGAGRCLLHEASQRGTTLSRFGLDSRDRVDRLRAPLVSVSSRSSTQTPGPAIRSTRINLGMARRDTEAIIFTPGQTKARSSREEASLAVGESAPIWKAVASCFG